MPCSNPSIFARSGLGHGKATRRITVVGDAGSRQGKLRLGQPVVQAGGAGVRLGGRHHAGPRRRRRRNRPRRHADRNDRPQGPLRRRHRPRGAPQGRGHSAKFGGTDWIAWMTPISSNPIPDKARQLGLRGTVDSATAWAQKRFRRVGNLSLGLTPSSFCLPRFE